MVVAAAYTFPTASTPRPELVRPESHVVPEFVKLVVEALSKAAVLEAKREKGEPVKRSAVPVAEGVCPQNAVWVKAS